MIKIFNICNQISKTLDKDKENLGIKDFKVQLRLNENINILVVLSNDQDKDDIYTKIDNALRKSLNFAMMHLNVDFNITVIDENDLLNNPYYTDIFKSHEKVSIAGGRRRLNSLLSSENDGRWKQEKHFHSPVITFYSYKGGVGRSTTLAAFAIYMAVCKKKNVFIIDCDLEAPGFTNFFLKNAGEDFQHQGLVEYLIDKECGLANLKDLESYSWEVSKDYSGEGSIRIMPSGNLNTKIISKGIIRTDLDAYIEGLSRIDFSDNDYSSKVFNECINDIQKSFAPDIILIDSRTGLNEIMGISIFALSDLVVGMFRHDVQDYPGLYFFIKKMIENRRLEPFLVNAILPLLPGKPSIYDKFTDDVAQIVGKLSHGQNLQFPTFPIRRNPELEIIGSALEDIERFKEIVSNHEIKDLDNLFEALYSRFALMQKDIPAYDITDLRNGVLKESLEQISKSNLYAENVDLKNDFKNGRFFRRQCMDDLFNLDKYLLLGGKGTGKTYIYKALREKDIVEYLRLKANKKDSYSFINTIDRKEYIFHVNKFDNPKKFSESKKYAFWLIYTWSVLSIELKSHCQKFHIEVDGISIKDDVTTRDVLTKLVNDDNYIKKLETEFYRLDAFLKEQESEGKKIYVTLIYDQIDEMVDPKLWNSWLPSLIRFWSTKRYDRIYGKIFLRSDIFRKLFGINNIADLVNHAINLDWNREEIFSFLFKTLFSEGKNEGIWTIMKAYNDYSDEEIERCKSKVVENQFFNLSKKDLKPLVDTFFGVYVDANNTARMGESYDWLYRNLQNADGSISLRPFIDLVRLALVYYQENPQKDFKQKPILPQLCYTDKNVRLNAVKTYLSDITSEAGNKPIDYIFEFISNTKDYRFKRLTYSAFTMERMLKTIIDTNKWKSQLQGQTVDSLESLLIDNGIVSKRNFGNGDTFRFAFLYKYRLGLRGH